MGKAWVMPETDSHWLTRLQLVETALTVEAVMEVEQERDRPDRALLAASRYRVRQLDIELTRRDLGGC